MKKKYFCVLLVFSVFFVKNICSETRIGILKGMDSIPFAFMYSDNLKNQDETEQNDEPELKTEESEISFEQQDSSALEISSEPQVSLAKKYSFQFFETPLELFSKMRQGLVDATIISADSAKKLAEESNNQVRVCAVVSNIDFKILTRKKGNIAFSDLIGNKIYVAGEGFAQKLLLSLLEKNSIPVEEGSAGVEIVVKKSQAEVVSEFVKKNADYVLVSEPAISDISSRSKNVKVALDLQEQCESVFGYGKVIPRSVLVVRTDFVENSAGEFHTFLSDLEYSVQRATRKPREAARIVAENDFGVNKRICAHAIVGSKYDFFSVKGDFDLIVNR